MIMPRTCNRQSKDFYQLLLTKIEFSYLLISISMILLGCSTSIIASNIYHEDFSIMIRFRVIFNNFDDNMLILMYDINFSPKY